MVTFKTTNVVIAMPITYTNLFATTAVTIFSTMTPITGGYLEKIILALFFSLAASLSWDSRRSPWAFGQRAI